ncbi:MAG: response regulator transcription factor [Planctomycetota bacterium]|jgi:DNA-binding response OmpR family regulator
MSDHRFHRRLDLEDDERQRMLEDLDSAQAARESGRNEFRHEFHATDVPLLVRHADGRGESRFLVYGRNISRGGIAVLHSGYVTIGADCQVVLPRVGEKPIVVRGVIRHCRLVAGSWHELGIRFRAAIDPAVIAGVPLNDEQAVGDAHHGPAPREAILVAESFDPERDLLLHQLTMCGLRARGVNTPGATLDFVQREPVRLVLSGLSVATDDGLRTIQRMREMGFDRPILMATADPDPQVSIWAREAGATSIVSKPINVDLLVAQIRRHIDPQPPGREIFSTVADQPGMPQLVHRFVAAARQVVEQLEVVYGRGDVSQARELCLRLKACGVGYGFHGVTVSAISAINAIDLRMAAGEVATRIADLVARGRALASRTGAVEAA